jgi:hypothetical protein
MLNKNVYPQAVHVRRLSTCLIAGNALGTVSTRSSFSFCQVLEPLCSIVVALPDEGIGLLNVFHAPSLDERCVDLVAKNVAIGPGTKLDKESGEAKCE